MATKTSNYITIRKASKKYGFTLTFLRNKIFDGLLDSRKEYVKYKSPPSANGSHCMRQVIVVNEDQVKKFKPWKPKQPPSEAWIRQQTRDGFTQKQMAIKWGINEHRLRERILELGLARSPVEAGKLRHRKDRPHLEKVEILPTAKALKPKTRRSEVFHGTLKWVDSLDKMPTQKEIEKHAIPGLISEWLIKSMIETRSYRGLGLLEVENQQERDCPKSLPQQFRQTAGKPFRSSIPEEILARAEKMREEGMSYRGIANDLGINRHTLRYALSPEVRKYYKKYRKDNKERIDARMKKYCKNNRERINAYFREYRKKHPRRKNDTIPQN